MGEQFDLLIVGAGPVGCVIAERAARVLGWRSIIVEKRSHIAGNCYDMVHDAGVLIHQYGPHYFRTNDRDLLEYLSQFTEWIPGEYVVRSLWRGRLFPFPINLTTLEMFFEVPLNHESAHQLLMREQIPFSPAANSEEFVLSRVGRRLYEAFYRGYTLKQWGLLPSELDPTVCGRIPVRLSRDERYVDHEFQVMPRQGYTRMFENMIADPRISVLLNTDFTSVRGRLLPRVATVFTGAVDEYFRWEYGALEWRSLTFDIRVFDQQFVQPCVQINYPNDFLFTRSVEYKHVTKQLHRQTVVSYEQPTSRGDPYYPVPTRRNQRLYEKYRERARQETASSRVYFAGRLATYRYMDMDTAIAGALSTFNDIVEGCRN